MSATAHALKSATRHDLNPLMPDMRPLAGRSALVTGSTSGMGKGIAQHLAMVGADVALNGFGKRKDINALCAELTRDHGVRTIYCAADLAKPVQIHRMMAEVTDAFGRIDILINNAGIYHVEAMETMEPAKWDATLAVNLTSVFHAMRAALPGMRARGWGRIINIASALGLVGAARASAYTASKHGVIGLTRSAALEFAEAGITVNAICPGYSMTPLIEHEIRETARLNGLDEDQVRHRFLDQTQPTGKFVNISEIAALTVFLCTDVGASITGAALSIDGGWTAH